MTENRFFEGMKATAIAYNEAQAIRKEQRDAMIEADDWDGVKAFDEREEKEFPCPFASGENKALVQYDGSLQNGADAFEVEDLPWDCELAGFVTTLRKAGIDRITVTDQSTGLMNGIHELNALGCKMIGLKTVTRANGRRFGSKEPERKNGIEFAISKEA